MPSSQPAEDEQLMTDRPSGGARVRRREILFGLTAVTALLLDHVLEIDLGASDQSKREDFFIADGWVLTARDLTLKS